MIWFIGVLLLVLWALGMVSPLTTAGLIHMLLVAGVVAALIMVIQGRRVV